MAIPQSKEEWIEHHFNQFINKLEPLDNIDPKQVAAWHYISVFINQFMMIKKSMTLEDLENVMLGYDKFMKEMEQRRQ